jgi:hypothetical protein
MVDAIKILKILYGEKMNIEFYANYTSTAEAFFSMPYTVELQTVLGFPSINLPSY